MALSLKEFPKEKDGDLLGEEGSFDFSCELLKTLILKYMELTREDLSDQRTYEEEEEEKEEGGEGEEEDDDAIFYDLAVSVKIKRRDIGKGVKGIMNLRSDEMNKKKTCLKSYYIKGEFERKGEEKRETVFKKRHRDNVF